MRPQKIQQIVLASRPTTIPSEDNFAFQDVEWPSLKNEEVLIQTLFLSVDPYMRGRMNDRPSYIAPFQIDQPITGGIVGEVIESKSPHFKVGDNVVGFSNWANFNIALAKDLQKISSNQIPLSAYLGVLGMPGMTAYFGLLEIGHPKSGETVVVSGAAGAVGLVVGQIAKIYGCRVIGTTGSQEKVNFLKSLGFDGVINYKKDPLKETLKELCPQGIDIYFDNVGGEITEKVLQQINKQARMVICGQISQYNLEQSALSYNPFLTLLTKSALAQGFIVSDFSQKFPEAMKQLGQWLQEGKIQIKENIVTGLNNAPKAFLGLFKGENIGKQIVKL